MQWLRVCLDSRWQHFKQAFSKKLPWSFLNGNPNTQLQMEVAGGEGGLNVKNIVV